MDCFKVEKCSMVRRIQIPVRNPGCRVLQAKEEGDLPACYQRSVQKPASLMIWGCIWYGQLARFWRHYECWKVYIKVLEQCMLPSGWHLFQQDNAKPHTVAITTSWLRSRRVQVLNWPACSPDLSLVEKLWRIIKWKNSSAAGNLYQVRMGPNSNTKTLETHNLDAQTF